MARDVRDSNRSFKTYTIPRKERRPSEDCQFTLPVDSREAKEIEHAVRRLTWDTNNLDKAVSISHIKKVDNPGLEREYHEKRAALREDGRSPKELTQQLAFSVETEDSRVKGICRLGLECDGENHTLGDGGMGVTVWKCPDLCLRSLGWPASGAAYLVVYKIVKGRVKSVTPKLSPETPNLEPTPNYDCHMSRNVANSSVTDLSTLMRSTQYYLYEYDDEGLPSKRPRHCLPFAVIHLKRNESTTSVVKPPLSLEKPTSPVKESNKLTEDMKAPSFSDEDGILAWRGLVTSNEKSLGCVSLLAGHKLGLNFWKSYLDVSRKMPLKQLSLMLPGDVKSAWKSPLLYRNHVLSLCSMKPTPRQPSEKFTNFTRHLAVKAKAAGVLCIDSFTTLFLVPSSKLAVHLGFCAAEKPPSMFCIVCRQHSPLLSPTFVWPLGSPVTPPAGNRSAPASHTGIPAETVTAAIRPASLDLKAQHKAKIVVSSPESNFPKRRHPRQIAKRSLSFPFSPVKDANKSLLRISRSVSTSGRDGFREDNNSESELNPFTLDRSLELQTNCDASSRARECKQFSCLGSQVKFSISTHDPSKKYVTMKGSLITPSTVKEACQESSCTEKKLSSSVTGGKKCDASLSSISLTKNESPVRSSAAGAIPSPCSRGLSPFWPDSPIVFSSSSDKSPFLYDTPLKKDERTESERSLSAKPGDNWRFNLSQSRDELSGKMTRHAARRDEEADSTPRILMESPFRAPEEKTPYGTRLHLENWNKTLSFLSDKQALRSLRKAAALQKGPKLHKSTESHDDLQTIDMEISEPSNIDSSNLTNMGAVDSLNKEGTRTRVPQLCDDLQTVDMEISEAPECPIIVSHAYSCAPSVPLHDFWSTHSSEASGITPFAEGPVSGGSVDKRAHDSMESSLYSNAAKISVVPLSVFNDPGNSWKEDVGNSLEHFDARDGMSSTPNAGIFIVDSTTTKVDIYPRASESGDIVEPIDMDIADDVGLLSNTVEFQDDSTVRPAPAKMAEVLDDYNAKSNEEIFSSKEMVNDPIEDDGSLATSTYLSKQTVSGTSEDRVAEVAENAASGITTDHSNTKLRSKKRPYSCLAASTEQDTDSSVLNHLEQKREHITFLTTSDDATQMTCPPLPSKDPSKCSLADREVVEFSFSPKKSTKVTMRQLKTPQNAFTVATNCDQPSLCNSDGARSTELSSVKSSPRKSTSNRSNDCIGTINSDDSATMDESRDCKPLAVSCKAFERDDTDFPEHAGSHLGGVIETSLFQDWGVGEDSLTSAEHDGSTEVNDLGSQADQALEPIETWPVIDDGDFPDPEIVACSPLNSIETFMFRFPGESGFDEDVDEVTPRETRTTEEETILVEERFLGFFMGPEVVICSDGNSETIVTPSEELDSGASPPEKDTDEASSREESKANGSQCEDSHTADEMPLVVTVSPSSGEELSETLAFEGEDFNISEGSGSIEKQFTRTESCMEGCSEKPLQSLAPHSSSKDEALIQSEESVVFRKVESAKGGDASPEIPETEFFCADKLNTTPSDSMKPPENVSLSNTVQQYAGLNEGVTSTSLSYPSPTQSSSKLQCSGVNKPTDYTSTKYLVLKPVGSSAKMVTDGKPVEETIRTVQLPDVTMSQPRSSSNPETNPSQEGKTKESHCDSSDRDCRGKSEPLRDINDLQKDNRVLNGKRKLVTESENMAKLRKLSPEPPSASAKSREVDFGDNRLYRHYTERGRSEYRQVEYARQYSNPYWMAPSLPAHLPVRNGERGGLPRVAPNDPPWYPPRGVTNQNQFDRVYRRSPHCSRAIFSPIMYRARPVFSPPGTIPGTWQLPGNSCHVPSPLLGRR